MRHQPKAHSCMLMLVLLCLGAFVRPVRADTHLFAGALGTNQNDQLYFSNGILFDSRLTNYAFPQILRTNGFNKNYYRGDAITFSALPVFPVNGGPAEGCSALGSRLAVQVVSVAGPIGGSFAFWEGDGDNDLGQITFSVPVGTTNGTNYFIVSENNGAPGTDPYGHIHGREFTTSLPGTYTVGFRVIDISTNGTGGGPIHLPSEILPVIFQAGMRIQSLQILTNRVTFLFRSPPGITNALEATDSLGSGTWSTVVPPLKGNNNLQSLTETNPPTANRFYRLRVLNNLP